MGSIRLHHWLAGLVGALGATAAPALGADLPDIKKRGKLRVVAVLEEREPEFLSLKRESGPGFDGEVLQGFARAQDLKLEFVLVPSWERLLPALAEGKGDLVAGRVSNTPPRRKHADFTSEVFPTRVVVVNRKPRPPVAAASELLRLRVGTIRGTSLEEALVAAGFPAPKIVPLMAGQLSEALREDRVDAAVWALEGAILAQRRDRELQLGVFLGPPESLAYGVAKGHPLLLDALNEHIRMLRYTGTWNRLVVKYFGTAAPEILRKARPAAEKRAAP